MNANKQSNNKNAKNISQTGTLTKIEFNKFLIIKIL